jgi:hypothetical protein
VWGTPVFVGSTGHIRGGPAQCPGWLSLGATAQAQSPAHYATGSHYAKHLRGFHSNLTTGFRYNLPSPVTHIQAGLPVTHHVT